MYETITNPNNEVQVTLYHTNGHRVVELNAGEFQEVNVSEIIVSYN